MSSENLILVLIAAVVIVAVAIGVWFFLRKRQSENLRRHFGREYNHAIREYGDSSKAEAELKAREDRVKQLHIVALDSQETIRFGQAWRAVQARFVDDPREAVRKGDALLREVMLKRGYPVTDFERRAADLSVHYPHLVENYRSAREIALRNERGTTNTEEQRKALVFYRALFDELLEDAAPQRSEAEAKRTEVGP